MSQIQALTAVVVVDKEPQRPLQGVERAAKAPTAPRQAFEIGAQIGVETLNRVGLFFAHRDDMLASLRPDQFGIGGMAVAGVALGGGKVSTSNCKLAMSRVVLAWAPTISPVTREMAAMT